MVNYGCGNGILDSILSIVVLPSSPGFGVGLGSGCPMPSAPPASGLHTRPGGGAAVSARLRRGPPRASAARVGGVSRCDRAVPTPRDPACANTPRALSCFRRRRGRLPPFARGLLPGGFDSRPGGPHTPPPPAESQPPRTKATAAAGSSGEVRAVRTGLRTRSSVGGWTERSRDANKLGGPLVRGPFQR